MEEENNLSCTIENESSEVVADDILTIFRFRQLSQRLHSLHVLVGFLDDTN
jgi:hypothetical protein